LCSGKEGQTGRLERGPLLLLREKEGPEERICPFSYAGKGTKKRGEGSGFRKKKVIRRLWRLPGRKEAAAASDVGAVLGRAKNAESLTSPGGKRIKFHHQGARGRIFSTKYVRRVRRKKRAENERLFTGAWEEGVARRQKE